MSNYNTLTVKNKLSEIDFMRAICCVLVVIIHVTAAFWYTFQVSSLPFKAVVVLNTFSKFAVPSFVLISGYVLYYVYNNKKIEPITFYKKRLLKVFLPYFIWSVLYIIVNYLAYERPVDFKSLIYYFSLGKANYHLYYICLILQFYILFPLLIKGFKLFQNPIIPSILFIGLNFYFIRYIKLPFSDRLFMYYIMFFILGFYLADLKIRDIKIRNIISLFITAIYIITVTYYVIETYKVMVKVPLLSKTLYRHSWWYFSLISILFLYVIANYFGVKIKYLIDNKIINSISKHSFTIYLSHPMFMKILHSLPIYKNMQTSAPQFLIVIEFFIIFMGSWLFSVCLEGFTSYFKNHIRKKSNKEKPRQSIAS